MTTTRIYLVTAEGDDSLVDASSAAQAIRHVTRNMYSATPATPKDVARLMGDGVLIETAGAGPDGIAVERTKEHEAAAAMERGA